MIRCIGFSLIVVSSVCFGRSVIARSREQTEILQALAGDLEYLRSEIAFHLLPLPEALQSLADRTHVKLREVYAFACKFSAEFPGQDAGACILQAVDHAKCFPQEAAELLTRVFSDFGKQDAVQQIRVLDCALERLKAIIHQKESGRRERERDCRIFYLCIGLALGIVLI